MQRKVVILGTGGTIAGAAAQAGDDLSYVAGQRSVQDLVAGVPALKAEWALLELEQVAQVDSKDMSHAIWQQLAQRAAHHLARPEVQGVVVTHGTDTLEETAWFLHRVLGPQKPLVLTAAMRPVTSLQPDGPQNLLDAVTVVRHGEACGVLVVLAGAIHTALAVRKRHPWRVDAFDSGDAGALGWVEAGQLRMQRVWPSSPGQGLPLIAAQPSTWPDVQVLTSHAGASATVVDVLSQAGVLGLVVAGTGNGSIHVELDAALHRAHAAGVSIWRTTRCPEGRVVGNPQGAWPVLALPQAKARVEAMLRLMGAAADVGD